MKKKEPEYSCGLEASLDVAGGKWKVLILWPLHPEPRRFGELRREVKGISEKMLIQQLRELEADGIVARKDFHEIPPRVEYSLTELGVSLKTVLEPLCAWGEQHMAKTRPLDTHCGTRPLDTHHDRWTRTAKPQTRWKCHSQSELRRAKRDDRRGRPTAQCVSTRGSQCVSTRGSRVTWSGAYRAYSPSGPMFNHSDICSQKLSHGPGRPAASHTFRTWAASGDDGAGITGGGRSSNG